MIFCAKFSVCCIGVILALVILGFIFFKWAFVRRGSKTVIRGPWGFRVETEESSKPDSFDRWTCSCGETVESGEIKCPRCGKRRDEGTIDVVYEDHPGDDSDDDKHDEGSLIDF